MKSKYFVSLFSVVFFLFYNITVAQNLSLQDMQVLCNKSNLEQIENYLLNKGWAFSDSEVDNFTKICYSLNLNRYTGGASGWFYIYLFDDYPVGVEYYFFSNSAFLNFKNSLSSYDFKYLDKTIENSSIITIYSNKSFLLCLGSEQENNNNSSNYTISICKKGSVLDPYNGHKKVPFNINPSLIFKEYDLKDGLLDGEFKEYDMNGNLIFKFNYTKGLKNGKCFEYNYDSISLNQECIFSYNNDILDGIFECFQYQDSVKYITTYGNYANGRLNGLCQTYTSNADSLITAVYINDTLNGSYVCQKLVSYQLVSEDFEIYEDVNEWETISTGFYKNGLRDSIWSYYYHNFNTSRGFYENDLKTGQWEEYFLMPMQKCIGSYENNVKIGEWICYNLDSLYYDRIMSKDYYLNDAKHGVSEEFFSTIPVRVDSNPYALYSTQYISIPEYTYTEYNHGLKHGISYSFDSTHKVIFKGNYFEDEKNGKWFESELAYFDNGVITYHSFGSYNNDITSLFRVYNSGDYSLGKKNGLWVTYLENSPIIKESNYIDGKLNGKSVRYSFSKLTEHEAYYVDDVLIKLAVWDTIINSPKLIFENFQRKDTCFTADITEFTDGNTYKYKYLIDWPLAFKSPTLLLEIANGSGNIEHSLVGNYTVSDAKGNEIVTGQYSNGVKSGTWKTLYPTYKFYKISKYNKGNLISESFCNLDLKPLNGKLFFIEGDYEYHIKLKNGLKHGKSKSCNVGCNDFIRIETYNEGILVK